MPGRNVTLVCGVSGTGKTTFALRYLVNADLAVRFVFDPDCGEEPLPRDRGEFSARLRLPPAFDVHTMGLSLCRGWVLFDPHTLFPGQLQTAFEFFCEWVWEKSLQIPGRKLLLVDEAYCYQSVHSIPAHLQMAVQSGRRRGLHCMTISQQPNRLNDSVKAGVSELVAFKLQTDPALDLVEKTYGLNRDEVSQLQALHFVARNCDSGGELRGRIKI